MNKVKVIDGGQVVHEHGHDPSTGYWYSETLIQRDKDTEPSAILSDQELEKMMMDIKRKYERKHERKQK